MSYADSIPASAGNLPTPVEIFVGGKLANKLYTGRAPGVSAEDQLVFEVPPDAPLGCWVPVQVRTEGRVVSNSPTMAISADGGHALLFRLDQQHARGRTQVDDVLDFGAVTLRQEHGSPFAFNPSIRASRRQLRGVYGVRRFLPGRQSTRHGANWKVSERRPYVLLGSQRRERVRLRGPRSFP